MSRPTAMATGLHAVERTCSAWVLTAHALTAAALLCASCVYVDGPREAARTVTVVLRADHPPSHGLQVRHPNGTDEYSFGSDGSAKVLIPGVRAGRTVFLGLTINRYSQADSVRLSVMRGGTCLRRLSWGDIERTPTTANGHYLIHP